MSEKKSWIKLGCIIILPATAGSAGFFIGKAKDAAKK